jgi:hypothetical protein
VLKQERNISLAEMSDPDILALADSITLVEIEEIMVGVKIDVSKITDVSTFRKAAVHCCLNGPVGINKSTNFPGISGEIKIKDLYEGRFSNKMWKTFCGVIAERLVRTYSGVAAKSQQTELFGNVWPLNEAART